MAHLLSFKFLKRFILTSFSVTLMLFFCGRVSAQDKNTVVRLAKLKIDSTHLESYKAALKEEIEASVKAEPGVLSLYAVSEKDHPDHITIFEVYASEAAYISHRDTPHFKKYKSYTKDMVKSLELIDGIPILLGSKSK
jgi:quinol monooxygenase YgiN